MGLDMYLHTNSKKVCQEVNDQADEWEGGFLTKRGVAIYWRKANMIHKWFVDNVQGGKDDCGLYEVDINDLARLHDTCKQVLESTELIDADIANGQVLKDHQWVDNIEKGQKLKDPTVAKELLPTQSGFFFGKEDYDQYYWWDLEYTVNKLEKLMENLMPGGEYGWSVVHKDDPDWFVKFYYTSSW